MCHIFPSSVDQKKNFTLRWNIFSFRKRTIKKRELLIYKICQFCSITSYYRLLLEFSFCCWTKIFREMPLLFIIRQKPSFPWLQFSLIRFHIKFLVVPYLIWNIITNFIQTVYNNSVNNVHHKHKPN